MCHEFVLQANSWNNLQVKTNCFGMMVQNDGIPSVASLSFDNSCCCYKNLLFIYTKRNAQNQLTINTPIALQKNTTLQSHIRSHCQIRVPLSKLKPFKSSLSSYIRGGVGVLYIVSDNKVSLEHEFNIVRKVITYDKMSYDM